MPYNCQQIYKTRGLHSIKSEKMINIFSIQKQKCSCLCLACIDDMDSTIECVNQNNKYVKPWIHKEMMRRWTTKWLWLTRIMIIFLIWLEKVMYMLSLHEKIIKWKCIIICCDALSQKAHCYKIIRSLKLYISIWFSGVIRAFLWRSKKCNDHIIFQGY